jgi:adiponectin receptor
MTNLELVPRRPKPSTVKVLQRKYWNAWQYLSYAEIPDWMQDNDLIKEYYRPQLSFGLALLTLFELHNETVNVWSHLLGLCAFTFLTIWFKMSWQGLIFQLALIYTLAASVSAHLLYIVNKDFCRILWKLDHVGIAISCTAAFFPICFYIFDRILAIIYVSITCFIAVFVISCSLFDQFHTMAFRPYRVAIQLMFPTWSIAPMVHAFYMSANNEIQLRNLVIVVAAIAVEILGASIFLYRITEKYYQVNLIGSSHNIMHCVVLIGHGMFFYAVYNLYKNQPY